MGKLDIGRCGLCCSLVVRLSKDDINKIAKLGFDKKYFTDKDSRGDAVLRQINGYCRFVEIKDGIATCTIYDSRPKVCMDYVCVHPGESDCRLKRHYKVVDLTKV